MAAGLANGFASELLGAEHDLRQDCSQHRHRDTTGQPLRLLTHLAILERSSCARRRADVGVLTRANHPLAATNALKYAREKVRMFPDPGLDATGADAELPLPPPHARRLPVGQFRHMVDEFAVSTVLVDCELVPHG